MNNKEKPVNETIENDLNSNSYSRYKKLKVEKTIKFNFKVVKVAGLIVIVVAIENVKLLTVYQLLELTIYISSMQAVIAKTYISIATKLATEVTNTPSLHQKTSCYWQYLYTSD